jgi:hypothetical protein
VHLLDDDLPAVDFFGEAAAGLTRSALPSLAAA